MYAAILVLACILCQPFPALAKESSDGNVVEIKPRPQHLGNTPHVPVLNHFYAEFEGDYLLLYAQFSCGMVSVVITSSSGEYNSLYFDTEDELILIPISGAPGEYEIVIYTEGSLVFEGNFSIQ